MPITDINRLENPSYNKTRLTSSLVMPRDKDSHGMPLLGTSESGETYTYGHVWEPKALSSLALIHIGYELRYFLLPL